MKHLNITTNGIPIVIYTTYAIESQNNLFQHTIKKRKALPTDSSVRKVIYLSIQPASKKWSISFQNWRLTMSHFLIEFGGPSKRSPLIGWQLHRVMDRLLGLHPHNFSKLFSQCFNKCSPHSFILIWVRPPIQRISHTFLYTPRIP